MLARKKIDFPSFDQDAISSSPVVRGPFHGSVLVSYAALKLAANSSLVLDVSYPA